MMDEKNKEDSDTKSNIKNYKLGFKGLKPVLRLEIDEKIVDKAITELEGLIDSSVPTITENIKGKIEEIIDSEVPAITENIREEFEKLIDHKISYLHAGLKKIALIIFACTLPLTLGIWFLAFVLLTK